MFRICYLSALLWLCCLRPCRAQEAAASTLAVVTDTSYIVVRNVTITGNKRTRSSYVLRELSYLPGDTIRLKDLSATLEAGRRQLMNTTLFLNVIGNVRNWEGHSADLVFEVYERWPLLALPIFKLADRNFNQWWVEQGRSLNRVNVGLKGTHSNLTGRNDYLNGIVQIGYTQQLAFTYSLPYVDRSFRRGIGFTFAYSRNREINDSSSGNKQVFYRRDNFLREVYNVGFSYAYRRALHTRHQVFLTYNFEKIGDSVALHTPNYLGRGRSRIQYLDLLYRVSYIKADSWIYPLKGIALEGELEKLGIAPLNDMDHWKIRLKANRYWQLFPLTYGALGLRGQAKFPADQPYLNQRAMGYQEDYLRGLEYYVVDGTSFFILKSTLRRQVAAFDVKLPWVPQKFNTVNVRMLLKIYGDAGYTYSRFPGNGFLNNRMLYTGGIGMDIVSFYDSCVRLEYSINQLGQKGLFLHTKIDM
ncbi:POTRA domain-containing protein [Chitinophaga japonensis]|uniref:Surface antigen-like protein n=1 Tax=Chitinophaga japonensis TaxID=104662 RepID=A0A562TFH8_CHIJA|nr:POTRA domain-containing protein [Chitinophaga japonensis]TWI92024.1 surface antigen-like protein [Chitinophaga japonensis]